MTTTQKNSITIMNYEKFYNLKDNPFRQSPDIDYYYSSNVHKELMHHLFYCIESDDAFVEITGEPGIGKTITVRSFLNQIAGDKIKLSLIVNPKITPQDLLVSIALDCGMDESIVEKMSGEKLFRLFHQHLVQLSQNEIVPIVIIDEAHSLSNEALEHLCLISNLETEKKNLIKIILLGQPLLHQRLQDPVLRKIENRITIRFYLTSMSRLETAHYIYHRLGIASESGTAPLLFSEQTINLIYKYSKGVPRTVNILCERTLMAAFTENTREINTFHVKKAYRSFRNKQHHGSHVIKKRAIVLSIAVMFLMACIYMIVSVIHSPDMPETSQQKNNSLQVEQKASQTVQGKALELTPTHLEKSLDKSPQSQINLRKNVSETIITDREKTTQKLITPQINKSDMTEIQTYKRANTDKLPIHSLFTKNSYCIVVSPDANRMVVFQGKPDFKGLTFTSSSSFQLEEGVYFLDKDQPVATTYTSSAGVKPLSTVHHDLSENNPNDLTFTQAITRLENPKSLTENERKQLSPKELSAENKRNQLLSKELPEKIEPEQVSSKKTSQENETKQLPSKQLPQKSERKEIKDLAKDTTKEPLQQSTSNLQTHKPLQDKNALQKASPKKNKALNEKTQAQQPKKPDNQERPLKELFSLPPDKRLVLISLNMKQLTLWKGTSEYPKLIKQAQIDFSGPEGIYILCKNNNKHVLFNPNIKQHLPAKMADDLWQKIDPITNVIPVIACLTHKKSYGPRALQVRSFVNQWESAWQQKDLDAYMQLYVKDIIYFYKLHAPAIKLNWKILKSSQIRIFSGNRQKLMYLSPATYIMDPTSSNFAVALFNQTYSDLNYSETGVMIFYLKYVSPGKNRQKEWQIYGRLRIY
jgi:type II secretory pathway predicted ATPase ExeA